MKQLLLKTLEKQPPHHATCKTGRTMSTYESCKMELLQKAETDSVKTACKRHMYATTEYTSLTHILKFTLNKLNSLRQHEEKEALSDIITVNSHSCELYVSVKKKKKLVQHHLQDLRKQVVFSRSFFSCSFLLVPPIFFLWAVLLFVCNDFSVSVIA